MKILICDAFDPSLPAKLARFGQVTEDPGALPTADVALVRSKTKCTAEWLAQAKALKLLIRGGVGLDNVDAGAAKAKGVEVRNTPEASSVAVAELAVALMMAMPNHLIPGHKAMEEGKFLKKELKRTELFQKTLGLLGVGRIGSEVAKRCAAFEMKVVAYDPFLKSHPVARLVDLPTLLKESDYLSIHTPLTDQTRGLLGKDAFAAMKKGVRIVNTGRGAVVDEAALAAALASGQVAGYATDVWLSDPPAPDCPLLKAPNVVMMPHVGASTKENLLRIGECVERLIADFAAKQKK